jgi:hypothetical protein
MKTYPVFMCFHIKTYVGVEVLLQVYLILALDGTNQFIPKVGALSTEAGWVSMADLNAVAKRKIFFVSFLTVI